MWLCWKGVCMNSKITNCISNQVGGFIILINFKSHINSRPFPSSEERRSCLSVTAWCIRRLHFLSSVFLHVSTCVTWLSVVSRPQGEERNNSSRQEARRVLWWHTFYNCCMFPWLEANFVFLIIKKCPPLYPLFLIFYWLTALALVAPTCNHRPTGWMTRGEQEKKRRQ